MISNDLTVPLALGLVVLLLAVMLVVTTMTSRRERGLAADRLEWTRAEAADLRNRVDDLARQMQTRESPEQFVITDLGNTGRTTPSGAGIDGGAAAGSTAPGQRIEGRLFIDLVLRESVVKAASLTHGLQRALAPENRNRIRFEMKQETKRARKQRRIDIRDVRREMAERQRIEDGAA